MHIAGQVAVVTGAARGIGAAVAFELAGYGAVVALVDRDRAVHDAAAKINQSHPEPAALAFVGNVTDDGFRSQVFAEVAERCGPPGICVPAAGVTKDALAVKVDKPSGKACLYPADDFRKIIDVDLLAPIYWGLELIRGLAERRTAQGFGKWQSRDDEQGVVVFIGSVSARGNRGQVAYAAAKAGLAGAAFTLAQEAMYFGVRCAIVHPGFTDTAMAQALGGTMLAERILPRTRLGRLIAPAEVASAVRFLVENPAASTELWLDAGWQPAP